MATLNERFLQVCHQLTQAFGKQTSSALFVVAVAIPLSWQQALYFN